MVVIRGTKKFLDRVGPPLSEPPPSTTVLGDWYANVLFWRPQAALFVNERTLLPILVPLAPGATVVSRLRATVELVLGLHGLAGSFIAHKLYAMENAVLAKTASRSVVGMLNEFGYLAAPWRPSAGNLLDLSLRLATVPCGPAVQDPHRPPSRPRRRRRRLDSRAPLIPPRPRQRPDSQASRRVSLMRPTWPSPGSRRSVPG